MIANSPAKKILVVEDNDFVRMQIVKFLQDASCEVVEATDGKEALGLVSDEFDIAVVDVRMEPMGGMEFVRTLRGEDITLPVVFVTGDDDPELLPKSQQYGVSAVLMKPVQKDRLVQVVERATR